MLQTPKLTLGEAAALSEGEYADDDEDDEEERSPTETDSDEFARVEILPRGYSRVMIDSSTSSPQSTVTQLTVTQLTGRQTKLFWIN